MIHFSHDADGMVLFLLDRLNLKREHKKLLHWQEINFTKQYTNTLISQKRAVDFKRQRVNDQRALSLSYLNEPRSLISHIDFSRNTVLHFVINTASYC